MSIKMLISLVSFQFKRHRQKLWVMKQIFMQIDSTLKHLDSTRHRLICHSPAFELSSHFKPIHTQNISVDLATSLRHPIPYN